MAPRLATRVSPLKAMCVARLASGALHETHCAEECREVRCTIFSSVSFDFDIFPRSIIYSCLVLSMLAERALIRYMSPRGNQTESENFRL